MYVLPTIQSCFFDPDIHSNTASHQIHDIRPSYTKRCQLDLGGGLEMTDGRSRLARQGDRLLDIEGAEKPADQSGEIDPNKKQLCVITVSQSSRSLSDVSI